MGETQTSSATKISEEEMEAAEPGSGFIHFLAFSIESRKLAFPLEMWNG
jgi:hypothetical protein